MKKLVLCGVMAGMTAAMVMMTGCGAKEQRLAPPPGQAGILGNREIVPPPFESPDDLKRLQRPGVSPKMDVQRNLGVLPPEPVLAVYGPGAKATAPVQAGNTVPVGGLSQVGGQAAGYSQMGGQVAGYSQGTGAGQLQSVIPVADLNSGTMTSIIPPPEMNDANVTVSPMFTDMRNNARPQGAVDLNNPRQNPSPLPGAPNVAAPATPQTPVAPANKTYTVKANDTLLSVSRRYGVAWSELAALNGLSYQSRLKIGDVLVLPAHAKLVSSPAVPPKAAAASGKTSKNTAKTPATSASSVKKPLPANGMYSVVDGDSLWKIAHTYGLKSDDIRAWNNLKTDKLQIGQKLTLKAPEGFKPVASDNKAGSTANPANVKAPASSANSGKELGSNMHIVVSGDNLWTLARKYKVTTKDLEKWNNLKSPNLRIGRALIVKAPAQDGTVEEKAAAPANTAAKTAAPQTAPAQPVMPDLAPLKIPVNGTGTTNEVVNVRDDNGEKLGGAVLNVNALKAAAEKPSTTTYIVKATDSFETLKNAYGWTTDKLKELNPQLKDQDELKAGMEIKVPLDEQ